MLISNPEPSLRPCEPFKVRCVKAAVRPLLRTAHSTGITPNQKCSSLGTSHQPAIHQPPVRVDQPAMGRFTMTTLPII